MNGSFTRLTLLGALLPILAVGGPHQAGPRVASQVADPTKFDCRVVVRTRTIKAKGITRTLYVVKECPHLDKLAAGQCETSWLWGMRCKN